MLEIALTGLIPGLLVLISLLSCSAVISGSEVAFFSLSPRQKDELIKSETKSAKRIISLVSKPQHLLAVILILNNLVNVAIVILSTFMIDHLLDIEVLYIGPMSISAETVQFVITLVFVTSLLVLVGEVTPKIYAVSENLEIARFMSAPLLVSRKLLWYLTDFMVRSSSFLEDRLAQRATIDRGDLNKAIEITNQEKSDSQDITILKGIIHFGNTSVKQIMLPRMDVVAIDIATGFKDIVETLKDGGFSRIPVYQRDLDNIKGILYVKDLLAYLNSDDDFKWQDLIREPIFVHETKKIDDLLKEIQESRKHMAIVVDEYGGTSGLVTLEDILEEVIGEIKDEFDEIIEIDYKKIDDSNYEFEGRAMINDLCKILTIDPYTFDEVRGESDSLAGLVLELEEKIPEKDDIVHFGRFQFKVLAVENNRIERVAVKIDEIINEDN